MNRTTIDFGIDLGTTNSAIAVLNGVQTEIIKTNNDHDIMPSAVYIDKKGRIHTGMQAWNALQKGTSDAFFEFKRHMGTDREYRFQSSGEVRKPEELSAEILKVLRAEVQHRKNEVIEASVITVPASFELHQCDATRQAARIAGLSQSPLLQEPVAAAMAYGFQVEEQKSYWLVYDFGGGTFDAAIIKAEEGTIHVVNHGGDNFLGGSDIDWVIVEQILAPRLCEEYDLPNFRRGEEKWRRAFKRLKRAAEGAKILLSRNETALVECEFVGHDQEEIQFDYDLSRSDLIRVAEPIIIKSIDIAQRVLAEKNLSKGAVEKVVLVGGATLAPYFREIVADRLGIPLDYSIDPLTAVARGAAVFAGTQRLDAPVPHLSVPGQYNIDLKYKPVGQEIDPLVGGKVFSKEQEDLTGFTLEVVNSKTQWRSGKIPLGSDGVFMVNLHAEKDERNTFVLELFGASGQQQKLVPDRLTYTVGSVVDEQPLIQSMGVALANNEPKWFFQKGRGLPLKKTQDLKTAHPVRQGQTSDVIRIPIIEGDQGLADRNRKVGELTITGDEIRRDLPAGSDIEVTMRIDESRVITVTSYVPVLDEDFVATLKMNHTVPAPGDLKDDFEGELKRMRGLRGKAIEAGADTSEEVLQQVEESKLVEEVRAAVEAAECDKDAALKCEKRLLELKIKLDEASNALEWPKLEAEVREWLNDLEQLVTNHGSATQSQKEDELSEQIEEIIEQKQTDRLRKKLEQVKRLYYEILFEQPSFWVSSFRTAEQEAGRMTDPGRAERLLDHGRDCLANNNVSGLKNVVRQLWDLLPQEVVEQTQRGFKSGLVN